MNDKHRNIIIIYCSTIFVGGLLPFVLCFKTPLQTSLDIIRTISIMATSIFALIYFDPFGLKKKRKERQYENVIKLLEMIVGKRIAIDIEDNRINAKFSKGFAQFFITKKNISRAINKKDEFLTEYLDQFISVDVNDFFESQKSLIELKNNIWTPKEISQKIILLDVSTLSTMKDDKNVSVKLKWNKLNKSEENFANFINNEQITLRKIIEQYELIIQSCEDWLKSHSFSAEGLNL